MRVRIKKKRLSDHVLKCNGIDRVDSSKGYTVENSVACCKYCNTAKNTMTESEFYTWTKGGDYVEETRLDSLDSSWDYNEIVGKPLY